MLDGLVLAVDPGVRGCGVALFRGEVLEQAVYVVGHGEGQRAESWISMVDAVREFIGERVVTHLVLELPQVYVQSKSKGDPNDLINLAAVVGGLSVAFRTAKQRVFLPFEWKGQVPKAIMHERALSRLLPEEAKRISCRKKSLLHNVLDALALGLEFLGRMRAPRLSSAAESSRTDSGSGSPPASGSPG